jgi:hypothetical protein
MPRQRTIHNVSAFQRGSPHPGISFFIQMGVSRFPGVSRQLGNRWRAQKQASVANPLGEGLKRPSSPSFGHLNSGTGRVVSYLEIGCASDGWA